MQSEAITQEETDQILRDIIAVVRRRSPSSPGSPDQSGDFQPDDDMLVNALTGPVRVYSGEKTKRNEFFIDMDDRDLTDGLSAEQQQFVVRKRIQQETREKQRDAAADRGEPPADELTLAAIVKTLQNKSSQLAELFIDRRTQLLVNFLVQFDKTKRGIQEQRLERATDVTGAGGGGRSGGARRSGNGRQEDAAEILKQEEEFQDTLLKRIEVLRIEILTEFRDLGVAVPLNAPIVLPEFRVLAPPPAAPAAQEPPRRPSVVRPRPPQSRRNPKRGDAKSESGPTPRRRNPPRRRPQMDDNDDDDEDDADDFDEDAGTSSTSTSTTSERASKKRRRTATSTESAVVPELTETDRARIKKETAERIVQTLVNAINEIDRMIGLRTLKQQLSKQIVALLLSPPDRQFDRHINIILFGQPGTGKTSSAEKIGNIFRALGVLPKKSSADFVTNSYDRSRLVGGFEGQTAIKTRQAFASSYGSVMFIDEFYTLKQGDRDEVGQEAVDTIVKEAETYKGQVLIIAAGYEDKIRNQVFRSNEGIPSRFPNQWRLPSYEPKQLFQIIKISGRLCPTVCSIGARVENRIHSHALAYLRIGNDVDPAVDRTLRELVGRAWEKNMFEDTNARGAINLKKSISDEKSARLFLAFTAGRANLQSLNDPVTLTDVYRGFVQWARNEKNVRVYFLDRVVENLVSPSGQLVLPQSEESMKS